jgi:hypothetical protein
MRANPVNERHAIKTRTLANARNRKAGIDALEQKLGAPELAAEILSYEVQQWAIQRLRDPEPTFKKRRELRFEMILDAIVWLLGRVGKELSGRCCIFDYRMEELPAAVVNVDALLLSLRTNPFLISGDGLIVSNLNFSTFFLFDYDGDDLEKDGADVSAVGLLHGES